jgi:hypothetical protein
VVIAIALVASIAAVTAASTSGTPPVSKPFDWKSMCAKTKPDLSWLPVCDLLKMVTDLQNQINAIQSAPEPLKVMTGRFTGSETIVDVPAGFTKAQCSCNAAVDYVPPKYNQEMYLQGFQVEVDPSPTNGWQITSTGYYMGSQDPTSQYPLEGWYIVVCQK